MNFSAAMKTDEMFNCLRLRIHRLMGERELGNFRRGREGESKHDGCAGWRRRVRQLGKVRRGGNKREKERMIHGENWLGE
jgi:hypothetical protein